MKFGPRRNAACVLLVLATALAAPTAASADDGEGPQKADKVVSLSAWTAINHVYQSAVSNRALSMRAINEAFATAVKRARKQLTLALAKPVTPAQKRAASAKFRAALDLASEARQAAINALPELPPTPGPKPRGK